MRFSKIYIQKNFVPNIVEDQFGREVIGIEVTLNEGDSMEDAKTNARDYITEYIFEHTVIPPHQHIEERYISQPPEPKVLPEIQVEKGLGATLEEQILSSPDISVLRSYSIIARNNPILHDAYYKREYELNQELKQLQP